MRSANRSLVLISGGSKAGDDAMLEKAAESMARRCHRADLRPQRLAARARRVAAVRRARCATILEILPELRPARLMFQVRIHGRGGQGAVTAAEMLSVAAFDEGLHAQAFPTFGSERTGAPVVAFCRIDEAPMRAHDPVDVPDAVFVQDPTLLHQIRLVRRA